MNKMAERITNTEAAEAAFSNFRRQQRRPSNLLQCMDKDGNIDAFRYIEYSRQRRMAFLKRADFICKMKSTLRLQQQQQQELNRSASLPGMTGLPGVVSSSQANATFGANVVTPEMLHKSLGRRNSMGAVGVTTGGLPILSRSASMPFVSSFASNQVRRSSLGNNHHHHQQKNTTLEATSASAPPARRLSLRKEEVEAAEALLFGMSRGSKTEKRSSEESGKTSEKAPTCKKQKLQDTPNRTEEMTSVLSVVSTEEETSSNNNNNNNNSNNNSNHNSTSGSNTLHEDEGIARVKSTENSD